MGFFDKIDTSMVIDTVKQQNRLWNIFSRVSRKLVYIPQKYALLPLEVHENRVVGKLSAGSVLDNSDQFGVHSSVMSHSEKYFCSV